MLYPSAEESLELEDRVRDFAASLFWVLESKRCHIFQFNHYRYNKLKRTRIVKAVPRSHWVSQGILVPWHFNTVRPKVNFKMFLTVLMSGHYYLDSLIVSDLIGQMKGKINWFC